MVIIVHLQTENSRHYEELLVVFLQNIESLH